ncbi:Fatty acyl-CoA elongase/Polyunsaturated fatty acid specific elongation enzyme [Umbelopsis sp. WA50703]
MAAQQVLDKFSLDTPFGVALWPIFDKVYTAATGKSANSFAFIEGVTPLSTQREVLISCVTYLVVIFGGQYLLRSASAFKFKLLFQIHNLLLTLVSLSLLLLLIEQLLPIIVKNGVLHAVCSTEGWTQRLELLYYLNYLVKYWELADTVFLVVKKKKLEFLHYFHHSMTMVLCYTQLVGRTTVSWVPIVLNLTVHVAMYWYYFQTSRGLRIWWKKYLTTMQICQFLIDLVVIYACSYSYFTFTYAPYLPGGFGDCAGTEGAAAFGCALLTSYLFLFINFYRQTYKVKAKQPRDAAPKSSEIKGTQAKTESVKA